MYHWTRRPSLKYACRKVKNLLTGRRIVATIAM